MLGLGAGRAWFGNRFSVSPLRLPVYVLRGFAPRFALEKIRQRPILPGRLQPSTFGAERLNFCVRDENRWFPFAIVTGIRRICLRHIHNCIRVYISITSC